MIGSTRKVIPTTKFVINDVQLEFVSRYKYLGLYMSYNGSFQYAQEHLTERATKAWFSIRNGLYNQKVWPVDIYIKSFETVIKPIMLYGCEIWGLNIINTKGSNKYKMPKFDLAMPCERLHIRVCKQILRVPKKATNIAVLAELGRLPMYCEVFSAVTKYYVRLEGMSNNSLLHKMYNISKTQNNRICKIMTYLEQNLNYTPDIIDFKKKESTGAYIKHMRKYTRFYFENNFFSFMRSDINRKLCTYNHFKQKYHSEPYLNYITDPSTRKEVTRFRISAHSLRIETGRYKKLDRDKRICLMCNSGDVEDEFHFIIKCQAYLDIRNKYLQPILEWLQYLQNE